MKMLPYIIGLVAAGLLITPTSAAAPARGASASKAAAQSPKAAKPDVIRRTATPPSQGTRTNALCGQRRC